MTDGNAMGRPVRFPAHGIVLEGILEVPKAGEPCAAVVVCHPHPLYGGDMYNNVVSAVCRALGQAGIASLRFNFRGVGGSEGQHEDGIGERDDVVAALDFLESNACIDRGRLGLAGYSFGTKVAAPVALRQERVRAMALVSPFLEDADWERLKSRPLSGLLVCGSEDGFISHHKVKRLVAEAGPAVECEVVTGADHFWWGFEDKVGRRIADFFKLALKVIA